MKNIQKKKIYRSCFLPFLYLFAFLLNVVGQLKLILMTHNFSPLFSIFIPNCSEREEGKRDDDVGGAGNPSSGAVEAEDPIQDHPQLHRKFMASLGNMKPHFKNENGKEYAYGLNYLLMIFLLITEN